MGIYPFKTLWLSESSLFREPFLFISYVSFLANELDPSSRETVIFSKIAGGQTSVEKY